MLRIGWIDSSVHSCGRVRASTFRELKRLTTRTNDTKVENAVEQLELKSVTSTFSI